MGWRDRWRASLFVILLLERGKKDVLNREAVNRAALNLVNICIDRDYEDEMTGRLYNRYSEKAVNFDDVSGLLMQMERLMDWIDFPQAHASPRRFASPEKCGCIGEQPRSTSGSQRGMDARWYVNTNRRDGIVKGTDEILSETGKRATFLVNVQYRQNATWQGRVLWAETGRSCYFRSALELLKLMDGALDELPEEAREQVGQP